MTKRTDTEAIHRLEQSLQSQTQSAPEQAYDARIALYVEAELNGKAADQLYPDVRGYLDENEQARALYQTLHEWAEAELADVLPNTGESIAPDLAFLTSPDENPASFSNND